MRRVLFLVIVLCLIGPKTALPANHSGKLPVKAALVAEYGSGKILYSQDPNRRIAPASVTKVMTMYLVFDLVAAGKASFSDKVKVSRRADSTGGSTMNLRAGETVTLDELMRGMAVASGNDAAVAVAEHFGGVPQWVARMNRKARDLGMKSTHFVNPNGLPARGQLTTAGDLMKLAQSYLRHYPQALHYHSTTIINHCGAVHGNTNQLLGVCEGMDGIKTGFVSSSGFNIIATAKRGKTRVIAVVLGGRTKQIRNRETKRVLDAAFTGSITSMMAANTTDSRPVTPTKIKHRGTKRHASKSMRLATTERKGKISSRRGASAHIDGHEVHVKKSRHASKAKATTSHTKKAHSGKTKKKAGASSR